MSNTQNNKGKLVASAVVFMLVIVPIISYFFLRRGFEYRKESLTQLEEKSLDVSLRSSLDEYAPHHGFAQLIHLPSSKVEEEMDILMKIDERIVDRDRFEIISLQENPTTNDELKIDFVSVDKPIASEYSFLLVDTSNVIRGTYAYTDEVGKELIRHLSVVIPVPKRKTITLQRDSL